ncbi:MAG: 30S ribosomal protein S15 [bacterium]
MSTTEQEKAQIIKEHQLHDKDTGSPEVQISLLSNRIAYMTEHMKVHKKDFHSRLGLLKMVGRRRRLLDYLMKSDIVSYRQVIKDLGLRR